ncbi:hypothetical protein T10_9637 [Trichinella papuae]|uniref:Uncharacterized protein n=1 Tax=Trichinella papuae TaxID=268474 RepID=A0A0V1N2W6_9BILA|nr:hypothetical protein T10_9637 [Trichinella papuae]
MYEICTSAFVAEPFKEFIFPIIMRCHTRLTNFDNVQMNLLFVMVYCIKRQFLSILTLCFCLADFARALRCARSVRKQTQAFI